MPKFKKSQIRKIRSFYNVQSQQTVDIKRNMFIQLINFPYTLGTGKCIPQYRF